MRTIKNCLFFQEEVAMTPISWESNIKLYYKNKQLRGIRILSMFTKFFKNGMYVTVT